MKLWVDDIRPAPKGWVWAKTINDIVKYMYTNFKDVKIISLDHDLGYDDVTGYTIACSIEQLVRDGKIKQIVMRSHSANPVGAQKIRATAEAIKRYQNDSNTR